MASTVFSVADRIPIHHQPRAWRLQYFQWRTAYQFLTSPGHGVYSIFSGGPHTGSSPAPGMASTVFSVADRIPIPHQPRAWRLQYFQWRTAYQFITSPGHGVYSIEILFRGNKWLKYRLLRDNTFLKQVIGGSLLRLSALFDDFICPFFSQESPFTAQRANSV
jgi:hypothetical protein